MKKSTIFQKARQRLIDKGWRQHDLGEPDGPNCALGAIFHTIYDGSRFDKRSELYEFMDILVPHMYRSYSAFNNMAAWNDMAARTKEDIIALYDDLISLAMSEEAL